MDITTFTIIVLFVYLLILKSVSLYAAKVKSETTSDYFLASRDVRTVAIIATTLASIFSTATVVGAPPKFFTLGLGFFWMFSFAVVVVSMLPFVFKFWILGKKKNFITPGDLTGYLFKSRHVQFMTAVIGLVSLLPYATAQIVAVGKTFEALTGGIINYYSGVGIVSFAIGLYLFYGGSRAVILTDLIQGIIFSTLIIATAALCYYWSDGLENLIHNALVGKPDLLNFKPQIKYYESILICATFFLLPHMWQRMYMARRANMLAKNLCAIPFALVILYIATLIIGLSAYTILDHTNLPDADNILGAIFNLKAPYFGALVLVAAFAAGMSTIDSQLLSAGALITKDILPQRKDLSEVQQYNYARIITMILLVLTTFLAFFLKSHSTFSLVVLGMSLTPILLPTVIGMFYWEKSTAIAATVSMSAGLTLFVLHAFTPLSIYFPGKFGATSSGFFSASVLFILISLLTCKNSENRFAENKQLLSDFEKI